MSGLLFMESDDFTLQQGTKGPIMGHGIPGFSLILFYSTFCDACKSILPVFKRLPGTFNGCSFGIINVSTNKRCVEMSRGTIAPIKYVPYIVLYIQGKPFMVYKGPPDDNEIRNFIREVANSVQKKQQFTSATNEKVKDDPKGTIPAYCTGVPIKGGVKDQVCYLEWDEAYDAKKK